MYLKRLDIQGFKTFAQRTTFVFPPGITAIVGANGVGKSNLVDAVRWVLGEQSFANVRCKKTEDLIFGGGKGRPPLGFADVALTIDNGDRTLPLPFDEVTIGRRAYRTGENEYFINRSRVRLRDLLEAVAPLGSSFTLINQGLVDAALALQPEDRQQLFEDAAEIGPYQAEKAEAERRLRETDANLVRIDDLLQEQEPQLRALKRQARDAEAVGAVEAELNDLLLRYYHGLYTRSLAMLRAAEAAGHARAADLARARERRAAVAAGLLQARESVREQRAALAALREAEAELGQRIATNLRERAVVDERMAGLRQRHAETLQREQALREECAAGRGEVAALAASVTRGEAVLTEQRAELEARLGAVRDVMEALAAGETALAAARGEAARQSAAHSAREARSAQIAQHVAALEGEARLVERDQVAARGALDRERERLAEVETALVAADRAVREQEAALDAAQHTLRAAREEREVTAEAVARARRVQSDLEARFETLSRLVQSFEGTFPGVRAAMQWAARAGRTDFKLVASIIAAPPELETAIETALGSRLQQIVVDHWEAAEAAIAELKRSRAGRATFLPLDSLRANRGAGHVDELRRPGILGRAAEMVEYDRVYTPVVELLLGRTLIAADLDSARAALRTLDPGWNLVTLAGEQVAATGALTGGAATKEAGTLRREREYRELPGRIAAAAAESERLAALANQQTAAVEERAARLRAAERTLREARATRDRQQNAVELRRRELHRAEESVAAVERRAGRLAAERATAAKDLAAAETELAAARDQAAAARAAAEEAEARLRDRRAAAHADQEALQSLRAALAETEAGQRARVDACARRRRALEQAEAELGRIDGRVAQLAQELAGTTSEAERLQALGASLSDESERLAARLQPLEATLAASEGRLQTLETEEQTATAAMIERERLHADAAIEQEQARSELRLLLERAAADSVTADALAGVSNGGPSPEAPPPPELEPRIEQLRTRLRRMGPVNALAPAEYAAFAERHAFLRAQLADVRATAETLRAAILDLDAIMDARFHTTFNAVAREFSAAFTRLFGGGSARLTLVGEQQTDGDAPPSRRGIEIVAQPPGKRQLPIQLLSGGERALTAAALLFAILKHHPRPFCIMDEVDAALDEANVVRFREALRELAAETQFIVVTHNRGTVEVADTLYGVSMGPDSASRVLSLRFVPGQEELETVASSQ